MKLSQKRTCSDCRFEGYIPGTRVLRCKAGFDTKVVYKHGIQCGLIPQEPCPKPLSYKDKEVLPFMLNKKQILEYYKVREHETNTP
jgi:hypothetical protein